MQYYDEAADDFRAILKLEPDNRVAKQQLSIAVKKQAEGAARERSIFAGMFHKFAQQDLLVCAKQIHSVLPFVAHIFL